MNDKRKVIYLVELISYKENTYDKSILTSFEKEQDAIDMCKKIDDRSEYIFGKDANELEVEIDLWLKNKGIDNPKFSKEVHMLLKGYFSKDEINLYGTIKEYKSYGTRSIRGFVDTVWCNWDCNFGLTLNYE